MKTAGDREEGRGDSESRGGASAREEPRAKPVGAPPGEPEARAGQRSARPPVATHRAIHDVALVMLTRRALSARELADRLERKSFTAGEIASEIRRLEGVGLVDDGELARAVCRSQLERGHGRRAIVVALRRRLVAREVAAEVLAEVSEQHEDAAFARALQQALRRHRSALRLPQARAKVIRYLLARGFRLSQVRGAIAAARGDEGDDAATYEPRNTPDFP
jgi:regulatory protein